MGVGHPGRARLSKNVGTEKMLLQRRTILDFLFYWNIFEINALLILGGY
jgi:hypothetical protein